MMKMPKVYYSALKKDFFKYAGTPEKNGRFAASGIITPTDIEDVEAVVVLEQVLGLSRPLYNLRQMCKVIPMDKLVAKIDTYGKLTAQEKVLPLVEAEISDRDRERTAFDLWKNVTHVVCSDEAGMKSSHDELQMSTEDAAKALTNSENGQIATIVEAATNTSAGSNWDTVTSGRSANNPFTDIGTAEDTINGTNGLIPSLCVAHPKVWRSFFSNDFVKGQLKGMERPDLSKTFPLPGLPGMNGISDYALTNTQMLVCDPNESTVLGEGPTASAKYRDEKAGYDAYIIRQWLQPKIVNQGGIYELTGLRS